MYRKRETEIERWRNLKQVRGKLKVEELISSVLSSWISDHYLSLNMLKLEHWQAFENPNVSQFEIQIHSVFVFKYNKEI